VHVGKDGRILPRHIGPWLHSEFAFRPKLVRCQLVVAAALAILTQRLIGGFSGVEYHCVGKGFTSCSTNLAGSGKTKNVAPFFWEILIMNAPLIRCDVAQWTCFAFSLRFPISSCQLWRESSSCCMVATGRKDAGYG